MTALPFPGWTLTERWASLYSTLGTDCTLDAVEHGWDAAAARVEIAEARCLLAATTAAERAAVQAVFTWLRQEHLTQH